MAVSESFKTYIEEQLSKFDGIEFKKMFGGIGLFKEGIMFSMISSRDKFFMRIDDQNVSAFKAKGMEPFNHTKKGKGMPYYEVPPDVVEDKDELNKWAKDSFECALRNKKK